MGFTDLMQFTQPMSSPLDPRAIQTAAAVQRNQDMYNNLMRQRAIEMENQKNMMAMQEHSANMVQAQQMARLREREYREHPYVQRLEMLEKMGGPQAAAEFGRSSGFIPNTFQTPQERALANILGPGVFGQYRTFAEAEPAAMAKYGAMSGQAMGARGSPYDRAMALWKFGMTPAGMAGASLGYGKEPTEVSRLLENQGARESAEAMARAHLASQEQIARWRIAQEAKRLQMERERSAGISGIGGLPTLDASRILYDMMRDAGRTPFGPTVAAQNAETQRGSVMGRIGGKPTLGMENAIAQAMARQGVNYMPGKGVMPGQTLEAERTEATRFPMERQKSQGVINYINGLIDEYSRRNPNDPNIPLLRAARQKVATNYNLAISGRTPQEEESRKRYMEAPGRQRDAAKRRAAMMYAHDLMVKARSSKGITPEEAQMIDAKLREAAGENLPPMKLTQIEPGNLAKMMHYLSWGLYDPYGYYGTYR